VVSGHDHLRVLDLLDPACGLVELPLVAGRGQVSRDHDEVRLHRVDPLDRLRHRVGVEGAFPAVDVADLCDADGHLRDRHVPPSDDD
jgi:hypothetical protein